MINSISVAGDKSNLTELQEISSNDEELALLLIKAMISSDPTERPPASAICTYPIFWSSSEILGFFQVCKTVY